MRIWNGKSIKKIFIEEDYCIVHSLVSSSGPKNALPLLNGSPPHPPQFLTLTFESDNAAREEQTPEDKALNRLIDERMDRFSRGFEKSRTIN